MSEILGVSGKPMYMVGGRAAREVGVKGQIAWSLQYINEQPALCMWRLSSGNSLLRKPHVFAICLDSFWRYVDNNGNFNVSYATFKACEQIVMMGFGEPGKARDAVTNLMDVILEHLEDLKNMKPRPDGYTDALAKERKVGEITITEGRDGRVIGERELMA